MINNFRVERSFGSDLALFQQKREELLGPVGSAMFTNDLMEALNII
jgi:hypothetical protein